MSQSGNSIGRMDPKQLLEESERLYEQYGKPLERDHWGEYVAITRDGRTLLGTDREEVSRAAAEAFGPGNFLFRVGPSVTNRWL